MSLPPDHDHPLLWNSILQDLKIPSEYSQYDHITELETIERLEKWKEAAYFRLSELRDLVQREGPLQASVLDQAQLISVVATFCGDGPWINDQSQCLSKEILAPFSDPETLLLEHILRKEVKPIFSSNPHPSLNLSTGRKLPRSAGGPMAAQDYYEGQTWKMYPGASNLVSWCVQHTQSAAYEGLWHLIIPPVMTLLDDYEAPYKMRGIQIVSEMLETVPKDILKRTGVDGLLLTSLTTSLTFLNAPTTPALLRVSLPANLRLILLTTTPSSSQRFDQLCALLGDSIIGNIWMYSARDPESTLASLDVLPCILQALGIGCARYLKALVPQLLHPLLPNPDVSSSISARLQLSSLRVLRSVIEICAPRMRHWKDSILAGVAKLWVTLIDSGIDDERTRQVKSGLRDVCEELAKACPSVMHEEYERFLAVDKVMFGDLVGRHWDP